MTAKIKTRLPVFLLAAVLLVTATLTAVLSVTGVFADNFREIENGAEVVLDESYLLGDEYTLPANVKIRDGATLAAASVILRDPSGSGEASAKTKLNAAGRYALEYRAESGGKTLIAREYFQVVGALYNVGNSKSSATYSAAQPDYGIANLPAVKSGIDVRLAKNDSFYYNKAIDFNGKKATDPFIRFFMAPTNFQQSDVQVVNITLTDQYDKSNFVTISVKRVLLNDLPNMDRFVYVTAHASNGQKPSGLEERPNGDFTYNGQKYLFHVNNMYGTPRKFSMAGAGYAGAAVAADEIKMFYGKTLGFSFDYENKKLYGIDEVNNSTMLIADLDDPALFGDLWTDGFSKGTAFLSMSCLNYSALTAGLRITDVNGISGRGGDDLSSPSYADTEKPTLEIDYDGYGEDDIPMARTGMPYEIFSASAVDGKDGALPVSASVWYNYASPTTTVRVSLVDGRFTPPLNGLYTVIYTAADRAGNVSEKRVTVRAGEIESLKLTYGAEQTASPKAGQRINVNSAQITGGSGKKFLSVRAELKADRKVAYDIGEDFTFLPLYAGEYELIYRYGDYLEGKTDKFSLTVGAATGAYIDGEAVLPKYAIAGTKILLPDVYGYAFSGNEPVRTKCKIFVKQGDKPEAELSSNEASIGEEDDITVIYKLAGTGDTAQKSYTIPVIKNTGLTTAGKLDMGTFFVNAPAFEADRLNGNSVKTTFKPLTTGSGIELKSINPAGAQKASHATFDFIRSVIAANFYTQIAVTDNQFTRINVFLTDAADPTKVVKLNYTNIGSWKMQFSVNNGFAYDIDYNASSTFELSYNALTKSFVTSNISVRTASYLDGRAFDGFPGGFVYISYQIEGVYREADVERTGGIKILKINNQPFSKDANDYIDPEVTLAPSSGNRYVGTDAFIPGVLSSDVLDPYTTFTMLVTDPEGKVVTSKEGVLLDSTADPTKDYTIVLSKYGIYTVKYIITGHNSLQNNPDGLQYAIIVEDMQAPAVEILNPAKTAKKGEHVKIASIFVSDDTSPVSKITVLRFVETPAGRIFSLGDSATFTAAEQGVYKVSYYVSDEKGNVAVASYKVTVS